MAAPKGNKFAEGNPGGGRPTKFEKKFCKMAYQLCLLGSTDEDMARAFDVSVRTINEWKSIDEFFAAIKEGKEFADAKVAASLFERACGYSHEEEKLISVAGGQGTGSEVERHKTTKHYPPDTAAAAIWLKNRQPSKWREKQELEVTGEVESVHIYLPDNNRDTKKDDEK